MNFEDPEIERLDKEIEERDEQIERKKHETQHDVNKFAGIALVSFQTKSMKDEVMSSNTHTWTERFTAYCNHGKSESL